MISTWHECSICIKFVQIKGFSYRIGEEVILIAGEVEACVKGINKGNRAVGLLEGDGHGEPETTAM